MNTQVLEGLVRRVMKGENIEQMARSMTGKGLMSPAEHRSIQSLSFQIAANVQAGTGARTASYALPNITWL